MSNYGQGICHVDPEPQERITAGLLNAQLVRGVLLTAALGCFASFLTMTI
jgi:hypothetical protein